MISERDLITAWTPRGRLYGSETGVWWMSGGAYAFMPRVEPNGIVRIYACGRDAEGRSRIGILTFKWGRKPELIDVTPDPVLDLGEAGCFDMDGVAYPCLVQSGDLLLMYYAGWVKLGGRVPWVTQMGLAASDDGGMTFKRVSRAPILQLTDKDPIGATSAWVSRETSTSWTMYYTKLLSWTTNVTPPRPSYNIWMARSTDGFIWAATDDNVIPHDEGEYALAAPCPHQIDDRQVMFFTARGDRYRLYAAMAEAEGRYRKIRTPVAIAPSEWDCDMQCYCHALTIEGSRYLFYAGNGFGRAGVGYAEWRDPIL